MNNTSEIDNILLNLSSGLLPKNLSAHEVELLEKEFGKDWFERLGYKENEYEKPKF